MVATYGHKRISHFFFFFFFFRCDLELCVRHIQWINAFAVDIRPFSLLRWGFEGLRPYVNNCLNLSQLCHRFGSDSWKKLNKVANCNHQYLKIVAVIHAIISFCFRIYWIVATLMPFDINYYVYALTICGMPYAECGMPHDVCAMRQCVPNKDDQRKQLRKMKMKQSRIWRIQIRERWRRG